MMGLWKQMEATGYYNAVYKIIGVILLPSTLLIQGFFPALSSKVKDIKKFQKIWNFKMQIMIFLAFPLLSGGYALASKIVYFLYGKSFEPAILAFQILLWTAFFMYLYSPYSQVLIIFNKQRKLSGVVFIGAIINVALNVILIPKFSLYGSAIATVITHAFVFMSLVILASKYVPIKSLDKPLIKTFIVSLVGSALMFLAFMNLHLTLIPSILLGIIIYLGFFAIFNTKKIISIIWKSKN